jgi:hypothetical protein
MQASVDWLARKPLRAFLVLFILSCSVQSYFLTLVSENYIRPHTRWESRAISVSLAESGRFADPYMLPTGPTAHLPPIPPALDGLVYKVFGLTLTAGYIAWLLRIVIAAALWGMLPWLAGKVGIAPQAGLLAGLAGALIPRWPGHGEGLTAVALGLLMAAFVRRWQSNNSTVSASILLGIAVGASFHVQPALLTVVIGWIGYELWWTRNRGYLKFTTSLVIGIVLACLPWGVRNYRTFDAVFFIRSNLGLELRMGNHAGAAAAMDVMDRTQEHIHPRTHIGEARKVQELGEVVYMRQAGGEALEWIGDHPGTFAALTGSRVLHWWFGPLYNLPAALLVTALTVLTLLGMWRICPALHSPQRAALLIPLLAYPLIYYVVAYMPRYRQPLDWMFYLLAAAALWSWIDGRVAGSQLE